MAVNINEFKVFVEYVSNKAQIGGTVSISQFNELAHRAQMAVFEKDRRIFLQTQETSDFLEIFLTNLTTSIPPTGVLPYPSNFEHTGSIRSYYVKPDGESVEVPVDPVKNRDWGQIYSSQLQKPTKRFPKYTEFSDEYRFLPMNIGIVMIDYFKTPTPPVWGYTIVSGRPVYDSATSTNFEFNQFAFNEVAGQYLSLIGVNLKDVELSTFAQMYKQEQNALL